jgi:Ca-activated chloride channel family protein
MSEVKLQCKLARNYTMEGIDKALAYLLVKVVPDQAIGMGRLPLNVALVLDVSGSMHGEKLACAKEAAYLVVETLSRDDWLSLIVFNKRAKVLIPRRRVDDKNAFFSQIKAMNADDGTHMYTGMSAAIAEVGPATPATVNRIILFTDGQTEGEEECLSQARHAAQGGLVTSTFGIGDDYNEELLGEISRVTLGSAYAVQHPAQIKELFMKEVADATAVGITNSSLTINLAKGVSLEELDRIVPSIAKLDPRVVDERMFATDVGGLGKTETTCFGGKLALPARASGQVRIAQVTLRYDVPSLQVKEKTERCDVIVEYTKDRDLCGKVDKEVMGYFDQLAAQSLIEEAAKAAQAGNAPAATQKLSEAKALTQRIGNVAMTQHLDQAIDELQKQGSMSSGAQKTIRLGSAHTVRLKETPQS